MSPTSRTGPGEREAGPAAAPRRGRLLAVIAAAQLMVVLGGATTYNTVVLEHFADPDDFEAALSFPLYLRLLVFGGLLLLGGRLGDLFGRLRVFRAGLVLFVLSSLLSLVSLFGAALFELLLIGFWVFQDAGAAIVAANALALLVVNFPEGRERTRAVGVYVAMTGVGLVAGNELSFVLGPFLLAPVGAVIGLAVLAGSKALAEGERDTGGLGVPGAVLGTGGLLALLCGLMYSGYDWPNTFSLASCATGLVLLAVFLVLQRRSDRPMLPLRLLADRGRLYAGTALFLLGPSVFAVFYVLMTTLRSTSYDDAGMVERAPVHLVFDLGIAVAAVAVSLLAERVPLRWAAALGPALASAGMLWFAVREPGSPSAVPVMAALFAVGAGIGIGFVSVILAAVDRVPDRDAGVASALANTAQHVGGVLGFAVLTAVFTRVRDDSLAEAEAEHARNPDVSEGIYIDEIYADGYTAAFLASSALFAVAIVVVWAACRKRRENGVTTPSE